jgi:para-aminobenzoate synthetase component 1
MIFHIIDVLSFKEKALRWAAEFDVCSYMDSNNFNGAYSKFDLLIAAGVEDEVTSQAGNAFEALMGFRKSHSHKWMTGFWGYDLKNETEQLTSGNPDHLNFPDLYFFVPQYLVIVRGDEAEVLAEDEEWVWSQILKQEPAIQIAQSSLQLQARFSKPEYIDEFNRIKLHIARGDIYVTNFCQEFFAEETAISPLIIFQELNHLSPTPFACFFRHYEHYILCASPERFLAKRGDHLISQPIKGTAKRGNTEAEDKAIIEQLRYNPKEQQENVMIVDLVRNDLTLSAQPGTVQTQELFGIYSFRQVHQMISTVTCKLQHGLSPVKAIRNTFPMGSMTGAPKLRAMQLIEAHERTRRGIYSGAIGYFDANDDFDFSVVIRTILYNSSKKYLSFQVGSAITFDALAEEEYAECMLKAKAIMQVLGAKLI